MEIKGFSEYLYLLKKNYIFKKVYANYGYYSYKTVLWLIKKPNKVKDGDSYIYYTNRNFVVEDYDISVDKDIEIMYVIHSLQSQKVTFRASIDVWLEIAHRIVLSTGISQEAKLEKLLSIMKHIPKDKWESSFIRFVYGFNHNIHNSFLLSFLVEISGHITQDDIVAVDEHKCKLPRICQFYDKFKFKFSDEENLLLWINLIKKEQNLIIESIDTHAIAHYLLDLFKEKEREQLFSFFPLMKEKVLITNNEDNPFDFERHKDHKRCLFEFHNEQMTQNISTHDPAWSYETFKDISDKFLTYLAKSNFAPEPQFISKATSPIYSAIVYVESNIQFKLFRELLLDVLVHFFKEQKINPTNKKQLLEDETFNTIALKVVISKHLSNYELDIIDDELDNTYNEDEDETYKL